MSSASEITRDDFVPGAGSKLIKRHDRAGANVDDLTLDVEVPQHVFERRGILLQHLDRHVRAVPDLRFRQKIEIRKLEREGGSDRRRHAHGNRGIGLAFAAEAVIGGNRHCRRMRDARRRHDGRSSRRFLDDLVILVQEILSCDFDLFNFERDVFERDVVLLVVPWQVLGLRLHGRRRRRCRHAPSGFDLGGYCPCDRSSPLPLGRHRSGRRDWRVRKRRIEQISSRLPQEAVGPHCGKLIAHRIALCRRCRRLHSLRRNRSLSCDRSSGQAPLRRFRSLGCGSRSFGRMMRLRRNATECARSTGIRFLRSGLILQRLQPLLNGRRGIGRAGCSNVPRLTLYALRRRMRSSLHAAFLQNTFRRPREAHLR